MALILKSDLQHQYSWTAIPGDDPRVSGEPDSTLLNRKEGYEILYFINKFAEINGFKQKASGLKVEKMIQQHVPKDIHSQKNIKEWLEKNWNKY